MVLKAAESWDARRTRPARDRDREHRHCGQDFPQRRRGQHVEQRTRASGVLAIGGDRVAKLPHPSRQDVLRRGKKNRGASDAKLQTEESDAGASR